MRNRRISTSALLLLALVAGCVSVDYVGKSYQPTSNVDVYMSAEDVKRPYEVIGLVRAQVPTIPFMSSAGPLQEKLVAEAKAKGADGVILGELNSRVTGVTAQTVGQGKKKGKNVNYNETTQATSDEVTELRGTLIRYKSP